MNLHPMENFADEMRVTALTVCQDQEELRRERTCRYKSFDTNQLH